MPPPYYFSSQQSDDTFHQGWSPLISSKGETSDCSLKNLAMNNEQQRGGKVSGIRQIVRLKELLHKWQNVTLSSKTNSPHHGDSSQHGGISPSINRRLKNSAIMCDSDEEGSHSPEPPPDVPKGFLAVYVGKELPIRRFIIPTTYLSHHLFKVLLEKAEEEFGFDHGGGLTIPCEIETFKFLLNCIETENQAKGEHSSLEMNGEHPEQVMHMGESSRQVKGEHLDNVKEKHSSETAGESSSSCREE